MSTLSQFGSGIKSIQRGIVTISGANVTTATATIASVNTAKSSLTHLGTIGYDQGGNATADGSANTRLVLTNSTTITAARTFTTSATLAASWELVEYY